MQDFTTTMYTAYISCHSTGLKALSLTQSHSVLRLHQRSPYTMYGTIEEITIYSSIFYLCVCSIHWKPSRGSAVHTVILVQPEGRDRLVLYDYTMLQYKH